MLPRIIRLSFSSLLSGAIFFASCTDNDTGISPESNITIDNNEITLNERVYDHGDTLAINEEPADGRKKERDFELILEKSLASPVVEGNTLQATSVYYDQGSIFVSYNFSGERYYGGAEYLNAKFKLISQLLYNNADINAVAANDAHIYLTGGVEGAEVPAQVMKVQIEENRFNAEGAAYQALGSFAGTSLQIEGNHLYVTTGDSKTAGGGLYRLDADLKVLNFLALHDARWVQVYDDLIVVAQGTPGSLSFVDKSSFAEMNTLKFKGADIPASKTTFDVADDRIFVAGGTEGVQVHSALDGSLLHEVKFESGNITNAVTADDGLLFISNGEGGLHVASYTDDLSVAPELIGKILFDSNDQSVNHVLHRDKKLYVASGLGGIKMISVKDKL